MPTSRLTTPRSSGSSVLRGAVLVVLSIGGLAAAVAYVWFGDVVGAGVLVGVLASLAALSFGYVVMDVVSQVMPGVTLLLAVLTYTLQLLLVTVVLYALDSSAAVSIRGAAAGVITVALVWTAAQIWLATRLRIPLYDLAAGSAGDAGEAGAQ